MDEVTFLVSTLQNEWSSHVSKGLTSHQVTPTIIDIRTLAKNKGRRYDLSNKTGTTTSDLIVCFEDSQTINYPTVDLSVRNEEYSMTMHIRCIDDERGSGVANFGRDRAHSLYLIARSVIESKRKGHSITDGGITTSFDLITLGNRTESNDKAKRLFGYKINLTMKRFAIPV